MPPMPQRITWSWLENNDLKITERRWSWHVVAICPLPNKFLEVCSEEMQKVVGGLPLS